VTPAPSTLGPAGRPDRPGIVTLRPLVVTLELDEVSQARFDRERSRYFPAARTVIGAHVTLFHALPGAHEETVRSSLSRSAVRGPFPVRVVEVFSLGAGVAYRLVATELRAVHAHISADCSAWLTAQDKQPFRPHVTVQNKVAAEVARRTLTELQAAFAPFECTGLALRLWRYEGGPWTGLDRLPFSGV
jgi:2'-5' RNA ligase